MDSTPNELSTDQLFEIALFESDQSSNSALSRLLRRPTREVFDKAHALCLSRIPSSRLLGVLVLSQLGGEEYAFEDETGKVLVQMFEGEEDSDVLAALCCSIFHRKIESGLIPLSQLKNHSDSNVRHSVAVGLMGNDSEVAIEVLIELSNDDSADVRNWATFALGRQTDIDTEPLRMALCQRLADSNLTTRREATHGLAQRNDERAVVPLMDFLKVDQVTNDDIKAAANLGKPELLPALYALEGCDYADPVALSIAIKACSINTNI